MLRNVVAVLASSLILILAGCSNTAPPERLRIIGNTPLGAAVGSELLFELGIDGGEGPYTFTLSNQPAWLAVEFNNNRLRPGVVVRGIPGVTGGQTTDDLLKLVYQNILLTVSDGKNVATREFELTVDLNGLKIDTNTRKEAELEDRPTRQVLNVDTRQTEPVNIPMCRVNAEGQAIITEDDMTYWLKLIDRFEKLEAGEAISDAEAAELTAVFGDTRPRLVYLTMNITRPIVADSLFNFSIPESVGRSLTPNEDYLTSVVRANGESLDLTQGLLKVPAEESICPIPFFINDDRSAEDEEGLTVQVDNISSHDYLPATVKGTLNVTDNEPTPGFVTSVGTITESDVQLGFDNDSQPPGTVYKLKVVLNDVPVQDKTADHTAIARLIWKNDSRNGGFATVGGPGEVPGSAADVVIDSSPAYVTAITDGVDVAFYEDTIEVDGEIVTEWVTERDLYFYAPANDDGTSPLLVDDYITLTWDRSPTSFENDDIHTIYVNEWTATAQQVLPFNSRAVAVRSSKDGGVYVGYEYELDGVQVADIVHYDRLGQVTVTLPLRFGDQDVSLADFVVREKGIPSTSTSEPDRIQDLFIALNVDALLAPPEKPDGAVNLGGKDFIVGLYRRINRVGNFDLIWNRQLGSIWDDEATSMRLNSQNSLYVTGITKGDFGIFVNNGGTDAFIMLMDDKGVVINSRLYGTRGDDGFLDVALDGAFNAFFAGYAGSATEQGAGGGGLDILTASFSDELTIRRVNQFGGSGDQIMRSAEALDLGFFAAGTTTRSGLGALGGLKDIFISYQRTASQLEALFEIGTPGEDMIYDVTTVGSQGIAAGFTEGSIFEEDSNYGGARDWWITSYKVIQPDPSDNLRTLELLWRIQGGDSRNEAIKSMSPTTFGKLFKLTEIEEGTSRIVHITPFALTDGRELSNLP